MAPMLEGEELPRKARKLPSLSPGGSPRPRGDPLARLFAAPRRPHSARYEGASPPSTSFLAAAAELRRPTCEKERKQSEAKEPPPSLSLTTWAVDGFKGLLGQEHLTGISRRRSGPVTPVKVKRRVSGVPSRPRTAEDHPCQLPTPTAKPAAPVVNEDEDREDYYDKLIIPLEILGRKAASWAMQARKSRRSAVKPRQSNALGGSRRGRWLESFQQFRFDGEIHSDDLPRALLRSGFEDCRPHLISVVLAKVSEYNSLDEDEFLHFMCMYEEHLHDDLQEQFQLFDLARTGRVDRAALEELLEAQDLLVRRAVLDECLGQVAINPSSVSFTEYERLVDKLRSGHCFLERELQNFRHVFQVFDKDRSGGMSLAELSSALAWLGFPASTGRVCAVYEQNDLDGNGALSESEWLRCLHTLHREEAVAIREHLSQLNDRCRRGSQLETLLMELGYAMPPDVLLDALHAHHIYQGTARNSQLLGMPLSLLEFDVGLEEIRALTCTLRARDGFTDEEMEQMKRAFHMQSGRQDEIASPAIQRALRWLGHFYSFDMVQHLVSELDVDGDCMLDFTLFVKLIRKCRDTERRAATSAFFKFDTTSCGLLDQPGQYQAIRSLGLDTAPMQGAITLAQFLKHVRNFKFDPVRLQELRLNAGYDQHELEEIRSQFESFDKDCSGELKRAELVQMIEALFPRHANLPEFRPYFTELLSFADVNQNDCLDFKEFVRLIRKIRDHGEEYQFKQYKLSLSELGFSNKEASEFRNLFLGVEENGRLHFSEVRSMIAGCFRLNEKQSQKLLGFCRSAVEISEYDTVEEEVVNFLGFLRIMRQVIDAGWVRNANGD
mmetsp:Transcript_32932/g.78869  ORF Transcript_32932/g.78869 Transcript_32932/m.78869 type:complete len:837 (+) Transcript_32932:41-2551(+)